MQGLPPFMRNFCIGMVTKTVEKREKENIVRKDLMQYLIQLRNDIDIKVGTEDEWKVKSGKKIFLMLISSLKCKQN
jgi:hypothetical protein